MAHAPVPAAAAPLSPLVPAPPQPFRAAAFFRHEAAGHLLVTAENRGPVRVWDARDGGLVWTVPPSGSHDNGATAVVCCPVEEGGDLAGAHVFATCGDDGCINILDALTQRCAGGRGLCWLGPFH